MFLKSGRHIHFSAKYLAQELVLISGRQKTETYIQYKKTQGMAIMMPTVSLLVILSSISQIMNAIHSLEKLHGHNQRYTHIKLNYINNTHIQGDQKVTVHPTITVQSSGGQRLFDHSV
jgi:hypothetical protein